MPRPKGAARKLSFAALLAIVLAAPAEMTRGQVVYADQRESSPYIAPFVPTPQEVVQRMLELAEIKNGDILYDLGSGDGRVVIYAANT